MKSRSILVYLLLLTLCSADHTYAETIHKLKPRLAVVITIDGMQANHLDRFWKEFENGGFKRLTQEGYYQALTSCNYIPSGATADYASLMTGASPSIHAITSDKIYSFIQKEVIPMTQDERYDGINSTFHVSARSLKASTLGDEIMMANQDSKVFSIALEPSHAVMLGGHLASGAIWLDDYSGLWATTNYYNLGLPSWALAYNKSGNIAKYVAKPWYPMRPISTYSYAPSRRIGAFSDQPVFYRINQQEMPSDQMKRFKRTPWVNEMVIALAEKAIEEERLGTDRATDLLCLELNGRLLEESVSYHAEGEDLYGRTDRLLRKFLISLKDKVGLENMVIVITSTPSKQGPMPYDSPKNVPSGKFNGSRSMALLNGYLMAIYGRESWVKGYYDGQIYLNRSMITKNHIKYDEICNYVADFMLDFEGVSTAYSAFKLEYVSGDREDLLTKMRHSYCKPNSGDIFLRLQPGWYDVDQNNVALSNHITLNPMVPLIIYGDDIVPSRSKLNYEDIIPTLCDILGIPLPNAVEGSVVQL